MTTLPAGSGGTVKAGETFEFSNTTETGVQLSGLNPPLENADYHIPANGTVTATAQKHAQPGEYPYTVTPDTAAGQPKIKISA